MKFREQKIQIGQIYSIVKGICKGDIYKIVSRRETKRWETKRWNVALDNGDGFVRYDNWEYEETLLKNGKVIGFDKDLKYKNYKKL
jgi:hypothetical protein